MSDPTMDAHEPRWDVHQQYLGPMLAVADVEASRRFYTDVLGFEDWFTMTDQNGRIAFCGLKWGNAYIMFDDQTGLDEETIRHRSASVSTYAGRASARSTPPSPRAGRGVRYVLRTCSSSISAITR